MVFELFQLHNDKRDKDTRRSWIRTRGRDLPNLYFEILRDIKNAGITKQEMMKILSRELGLSVNGLIVYFYEGFKREVWYPLVLLEGVLKLWKQKLEKSDEEYYSKRNEVLKSMELLRTGSPRSKPVLAIKNLTTALCKIAGAHAADGSLSKRYDIELIDSDRTAVIAYAGWIKECFGLELKVEKHKKENAWKIQFRNKVIGRYLEVFFGFPCAEKCYTVKEPEIIKQNSLEKRGAFALGAMTFDGSVEVCGRVSMASKSKDLIIDITDILELNNIEVKTNFNENDKIYEFDLTTSKDQLDLCKEFFERNTSKYMKIFYWLHGFDRTVKNKKEALSILNNYISGGKINFDEIVNVLHDFKVVDFNFLKKMTGLSTTSLRYRIYILERTNIVQLKDKIRRVNHRHTNSRNISIVFDKEYIKAFIDKLKEMTGIKSNKELSKYIGRSRAVVYNWLNKKSNIHLIFLDGLCKRFNLDLEEVLKNTKEIRGIRKTKFYVFNPNVNEWKVPTLF